MKWPKINLFSKRLLLLITSYSSSPSTFCSSFLSSSSTYLFSSSSFHFSSSSPILPLLMYPFLCLHLLLSVLQVQYTACWCEWGLCGVRV